MILVNLTRTNQTGFFTAALNLKHVAFARHHFVEHRVDEESQKQTRNQTRHNNDCKRLL